MSGGFGRKGVVAGEASPRGFGNAPGITCLTESPASRGDDGLSPQARAFIAAERARGADGQAQGELPQRVAAVSTLPASSRPKPARSMLTTYLLWWFGPVFAAHRFYLGAYRSGAAITGLFWGGLALGAVMSKKSSLWIGAYAVPPFWAAMIIAWMLWCLVDAFLIPGLMRRYRAERQTEGLAHVFA